MMGERLLIGFLVALLVGSGQMWLPCAQSRCPKAEVMACCHDDGISRPSCCRPLDQIRIGALASTPDPWAGHLARAALTPSSPFAGHSPSRQHQSPGAAPSRAAPSTTLLTQGTSLVL